MKIKDLATIPREEVITCFLSAFENYFVKLPADVDYWKKRFVVARVDWNLSFGMFDEEKLVAFIINGIDRHNGKLTAYNTGTGVLPDYRGKSIADQLYARAIPLLKEHGVEKCLLEVICENHKAIKVYERTGFNISRELNSFRGKLPGDSSGKKLQKSNFLEVVDSGLYKAEHYSWDNSAEAVKISENIRVYCLKEGDALQAYFVIDPAENIIQLESLTEDYAELLTVAGAITTEVQLKNVDKQRTGLIKALKKLEFSNTVIRFEMEMLI